MTGADNLGLFGMMPVTSRRALALATALVVGSDAGAQTLEEGVTIAFVGDQSVSSGARDVLDLIAAEDVDLLVLLGDYGYERGAADDWIRNMEQTLGPDLPVLGVVGNHENYQWPTYRNWFVGRAMQVPDLECTGDPGVKAHCSFRGVSVLQIAPGVDEVAGVVADDDYADYVRQTLEGDSNRWRICSWHKNQSDMQIGGKRNETGWAVYEACREGGGIVATGHEHSYSRTYLMDDFEGHGVVHRENHLEVAPGRSFAFVSGLGGKDIREQKRDGEWWAATYSATQGATYGALFCTFGAMDAACRFVDISGGVQDSFTIETANESEVDREGVDVEAYVNGDTDVDTNGDTDTDTDVDTDVDIDTSVDTSADAEVVDGGSTMASTNSGGLLAGAVGLWVILSALALLLWRRLRNKRATTTAER